MKTEKYSKKQKSLGIRALIICLAFLLIIVITIIFSLNHKTIFNNQVNQNIDTSYNLSPPTEEQKQAGEDIKKQTLENKSTNNDLGLSFSSISQNDSQLKIKISISGAITNDGTCDLMLEKDSQQLKISKPTFALTSYSTCQGFDINTTELSKGDWTLSLSVTVKDKASTINKTITLE